MQSVPLTPRPNQTLSLVLNGYNVRLTLRTFDGQTFADVQCNGVPLCAGALCRDRVLITDRAAYLGFPDLQLFFADLRGTSDPRWQDFGTRFQLLNFVTVRPEPSGSVGPTPRPPVYLLQANGKYLANGSQFAIGVVTS